MTTFADLVDAHDERKLDYDALILCGSVSICTKCLELWPQDEEFFYRNKNRRSGFERRCKACCSEHNGITSEVDALFVFDMNLFSGIGISYINIIIESLQLTIKQISDQV